MQPPSEGEAPVIEQSVVVWDVETTELIQRGVVEIEDMQISVACAQSIGRSDDQQQSNTNLYSFWNDAVEASHSLADLADMLVRCRRHVAFNGRNFDMKVLRKHFRSDVAYQIAMSKLCDPFEEVENLFGDRLSLNALLKANGMHCKSGKGSEAPDMWREGRLEELESYCMNDVLLLAQLVTYSPSIVVPGLLGRLALSTSIVFFPGLHSCVSPLSSRAGEKQDGEGEEQRRRPQCTTGSKSECES